MVRERLEHERRLSRRRPVEQPIPRRSRNGTLRLRELLQQVRCSGESHCPPTNACIERRRGARHHHRRCRQHLHPRLQERSRRVASRVGRTLLTVRRVAVDARTYHSFASRGPQQRDSGLAVRRSPHRRLQRRQLGSANLQRHRTGARRDSAGGAGRYRRLRLWPERRSIHLWDARRPD